MPVDESIMRYLQQDTTVEERTGLSRNIIVLELCLTSTYFLYQDDYYQRMEGAAVGSPVSPSVANIYVEEFEQLALSTALTPPRFWKRYIFLYHRRTGCRGAPHTLEQPGTDHPVHNGIRNTRTPTVSRHRNGELVITVYRKLTHTDRYISPTTSKDCRDTGMENWSSLCTGSPHTPIGTYNSIHITHHK